MLRNEANTSPPRAKLMGFLVRANAVPYMKTTGDCAKRRDDDHHGECVGRRCFGKKPGDTPKYTD
ncbi:hypothetical protein GCM10023190_13740 [Enteractinococcus fodinae]